MKLQHKISIGILIQSILTACAVAPVSTEPCFTATGLDVCAITQHAPGLPSRHFQTNPNGFYYQPAGIADDYPEESTTRERILEDLATAQKVGAKYLRFAIGWDGIEEESGKFNWGYWDDLIQLAPKYGITVIPYVCYTPRWANSDPKDYWRKPPRDLKSFGRFMHVLAARYRGKVRSWELWNEPDLQNYWMGSAGEFAEMVREGARQVRKADPDAIVVLGGMAQGRSPFFETLVKKYQILNEFDVINMHGYLETWDPGRAETYPTRIHAMRGLIREFKPGLDLWLAEFGYSNYRKSPDRASEWAYIVHNYEHTPEFQAVALWRHHILALASGELSLSTWYRIHDLQAKEKVIGDLNNQHLGILDVNAKPKPAYFAMQLLNRLLDQPVRPLPKQAENNSEIRVTAPSHSQSVVVGFEKMNGDFLITAWLRSLTQQEIQTNLGKRAPESLPGNEKDIRLEELSIGLPLLEKPGGGLRYSYNVTQYALNGKIISKNSLPADAIIKGILLQGDGVFIANIHRH